MLKSAAAIGILASGSATFDQVGAVQLVTDEKNAHKLYDEDDEQDIEEDNTLIETRKQLDMVEDQLNQMKMETEANLEIAEESGHKHKTKSGNKHHKKSKHIKNKKVKAHKKHARKHHDADDTEEAGETQASADMSESAEPSAYGGVSADDEAFQYKKPAHHKQGHRKTKRGHSGHKKVRKASRSAHRAQQEEDPFSEFEESLTKHHKGKVSHAQRRRSHKHHAHAESVPACTSLGCATGSASQPPKDAWPKDYPVANWGSDSDMANTAAHSAAAEGKLGAWNPKKDEDGNWVVPTAEPEFRLAGVKTDVRLSSKSDPICSSAGCTQYEHPSKELGYKINYPVPHFGADHDVVMTKANAAQAEAALGHTFTPTQDEDGEWEVPTESAEFKLAGVKADVHLGKKKTKKHTAQALAEQNASKGNKEDPPKKEDAAAEDAAAAEKKALEDEATGKDEADKANAEAKAEEDKKPKKKKKAEDDETTTEGKAKKEEFEKDVAEHEKKEQIKDIKMQAAEEKEKKEHEENKKIDSCIRRKEGGVSKLLSDDEYKFCHSYCQKQSLIQGKKGGKSQIEFEKCTAKCQKQSLIQSREDPAPAEAAPAADEKPAAEGEKKADAPAAEGDKKAEEPAEKKEDPNDPAVIKAKKKEQEDAVQESNIKEVLKLPDPCDGRLSGGKSSIVNDEQWAKCHSNAQKQQKNSQQKQNKKPEQKKEAKTEEKTIKEKSKLQTTVDLRSDPAFNSDDGYETRYMNPSDKEKIIQYPHDLAYDSDVIATQAHIKGSESTLGHKFDPVPFLAVQQKYDSDETQEGQESQAPVDNEPQSMAQQSSTQKSAVKTETKAKVKAQTKAEKMSTFVQMRKKMMSNWGTK